MAVFRTPFFLVGDAAMLAMNIALAPIGLPLRYALDVRRPHCFEQDQTPAEPSTPPSEPLLSPSALDSSPNTF